MKKHTVHKLQFGLLF